MIMNRGRELSRFGEAHTVTPHPSERYSTVLLFQYDVKSKTQVELHIFLSARIENGWVGRMSLELLNGMLKEQGTESLSLIVGMQREKI